MLMDILQVWFGVSCLTTAAIIWRGCRRDDARQVFYRRMAERF